MEITALILAGGRASRMGGADKGLQDFRGKPLLAHVLERITPQVAKVAISANRSLTAYARFGPPVWRDSMPDFAGPLAGLEAGLLRCSTPAMLTVPCDAPLTPPDLAARLLAALQAEGADVAVAHSAGADGRHQIQPVFCLAMTSTLPHLSAYLAGGGRKVDGWYAGLKVAHVVFDDNNGFRNINTLDELHADLSVHDAQRAIHDLLRPIEAEETLPLLQALGRTLARDIISPIDVPGHDNSAMDGFAFRANGVQELRIVGTVLAGSGRSPEPGKGECVRIMTGARMPGNCDTVIPLEQVASLSATHIQLPPGVHAGANRRHQGEDLQRGAPALRAGKQLRPADLGLIASLGIGEVRLKRRLRVAFFSTGDELRSIGQPLEPGCVYDSNRYTIHGMLTRLGCELIDMAVVKDDESALETALRQACEHADVIISSGGVSVGAADHTKQIMARLGEVNFWKINMRPGRPLAFGRIRSNGREAILFGLPGNPVAVMTSFYFFVRSALLRMMGADAPLPLLSVPSAAAINKKPGRTEYQRGILETGVDGVLRVRITGAQGSGILRSMSEANCIVVLAEEQANIAPGDPVSVLPFEGLI